MHIEATHYLHPDEADETTVIFLAREEPDPFAVRYSTDDDARAAASLGAEHPPEHTPAAITLRLAPDDARRLGAHLFQLEGKPTHNVTDGTVLEEGRLPLAYSVVDINQVVPDADTRLHVDRADWPTGLELEMTLGDMVGLRDVLADAIGKVTDEEFTGELVGGTQEETIAHQARAIDLLARTVRWFVGPGPDAELDEDTETWGDAPPLTVVPDGPFDAESVCQKCDHRIVKTNAGWAHIGISPSDYDGHSPVLADKPRVMDHDWAELRRTLTAADQCHAAVTRDGEQDACGKPPVAVIDGRGTEDEGYWPACAWHANRVGGSYGAPTVVRLRALVIALT